MHKFILDMGYFLSNTVMTFMIGVIFDIPLKIHIPIRTETCYRFRVPTMTMGRLRGLGSYGVCISSLGVLGLMRMD